MYPNEVTTIEVHCDPNYSGFENMEMDASLVFQPKAPYDKKNHLH
jgi:hypothetical protein